MGTASRLQGAVQSITSLFSRGTQESVAPQLSNPERYPFGEFEFHLRAAAGEPIALETSPDFKSWEPLDTIVPGKEVSVVSDKKAGNYPALFYRAVAGELRSNYLGFVSFEIPPGYSMVTNPLNASSNQIADLFPGVPEGSIISKFSLATFAFEKNSFAQGKWSNPGDTLVPGEGALFLNPTENPLVARLVGEVPRTVQSMPVQSGTSMRSSMLPLAGMLDTELGFPVAPGDVVSLYSNHNEKYIELKFTETGWEGRTPTLRLGEAFWVAKTSAAVWSQKLPE